MSYEPEQNDDEVQTKGLHSLPPAAPKTDSLAAIEKQFGQLVKELTQQLSGLERQLAQAVKALGVAQRKPPSQNNAETVDGQRQNHRYSSLIADAARRHEVDPLLVAAVIGQESGFAPSAVSRTGAMGLMQLMPDTARSLGVRDAFDPRQNIEGGTTLLRQLLDRYSGHVDLALAAYNAGPAAVDSHGGVPPYAETQAYVRNVMQTYRESALSA
ncbi:MAG: lytic transglycosylase domain-containing protein [Candidatus Eremiobacteraeota bacterium]|nr:lytic transglycosylase domain-containing protein [Candidatus Eremiobacteraeota bacterium]